MYPRAKKHYAIFSEKYFVNDHPPWCAGNIFWIHFSPYDFFPKPLDFAGHPTVFFTKFIFSSRSSFLLALRHFSPKAFKLFRTLLDGPRRGPWVLEICRGCQGFWHGCPLGTVGVLTSTVECSGHVSRREVFSCKLRYEYLIYSS